jgi:hypothetical protein
VPPPAVDHAMDRQNRKGFSVAADRDQPPAGKFVNAGAATEKSKLKALSAEELHELLQVPR